MLRACHRLLGTIGAILLASCAPSNAAIYYVDSAAGADHLNGSSPEMAWRTLNRASHTNLGSGDSVLLKRGSVWGEALALTSSGMATAPIYIGAYGSGARPILDGARINDSAGLITVSESAHVVITDLVLRNANGNGLSADKCADLTLRSLDVSHNRQNGILIFNCEDVTIEDCDVYANALDVSQSFDGIRIDGSGASELASFTVRHSQIHNNIGGDGWKTANGLFIGHTGGATPVLRAVEISGNDIYENGNPVQNQAGRGVTGTFAGDVTVSLNRIYRNASAGLYFGDHGVSVDIAILNNFFTNNALRQFGGFTDGAARAEGNTIVVDDPDITAMGAEMGGTGTWVLRNNIFTYTTASADIYRGFIRINDDTLDGRLDSDYNIFYSAGPQRWKRSDGNVLSFDQWRHFGYDTHSRSLR